MILSETDGLVAEIGDLASDLEIENGEVDALWGQIKEKIKILSEREKWRLFFMGAWAISWCWLFRLMIYN